MDVTLPLGQPLHSCVKTTADVIPHIRRLGQYYTLHHLTWMAVLTGLCCHIQGKHPVRQMLQSKTLAEVSYVEERRTAASK